jgi:predicted  nucleic acid-binding Zn-ribbon protein
MAVSIDDIDSIKKQIADAKNKSAKAEGAKERLIAQLSEDFDIENGNDIDAKISEYDESIEKDEKKLEKNLTKLDEMHDWDEE